MLNSVAGIYNSTSDPTILVNGITAVGIFIILTNQLIFDNVHFQFVGKNAGPDLKGKI